MDIKHTIHNQSENRTIFSQLPSEIKTKIFLYYEIPHAALIKNYWIKFNIKKIHPIISETIKQFLESSSSYLCTRTADDSVFHYSTNPQYLMNIIPDSIYNLFKNIDMFNQSNSEDMQILGKSTKCENCNKKLSLNWHPCKCQTILCENCFECDICEHAYDDMDICGGCGEACGAYMCRSCRRDDNW